MALSHRYESDWPLSRPLLHVTAHYDGAVPRAHRAKWALETTQAYTEVELCFGTRELLRAPRAVACVGRLVAALVATELARPVDRDAAELEALARGA